jgi:hypothetical protein
LLNKKDAILAFDELGMLQKLITTGSTPTMLDSLKMTLYQLPASTFTIT